MQQTPTPTSTREPRRKQKNDPKLVAAVRELKDRWLEHVNASPAAAIVGKYDVARSFAPPLAPPSDQVLEASRPIALLVAA